MSALTPLWIMIAGSAGATARFMADGIIRARFGRRFPFGTVAVNISGSLLLGVLTGLVIFRHQSMLWTSIAGTGFCGGFTTFSTASFETVRLIQERCYRDALLNGGGTIVLTFAAAALGIGLSQA